MADESDISDTASWASWNSTSCHGEEGHLPPAEDADTHSPAAGSSGDSSPGEPHAIIVPSEIVNIHEFPDIEQIITQMRVKAEKSDADLARCVYNALQRILLYQYLAFESLHKDYPLGKTIKIVTSETAPTDLPHELHLPWLPVPLFLKADMKYLKKVRDILTRRNGLTMAMLIPPVDPKNYIKVAKRVFQVLKLTWDLKLSEREKEGAIARANNLQAQVNRLRGGGRGMDASLSSPRAPNHSVEHASAPDHESDLSEASADTRRSRKRPRRGTSQSSGGN